MWTGRLTTVLVLLLSAPVAHGQRPELLGPGLDLRGPDRIERASEEAVEFSSGDSGTTPEVFSSVGSLSPPRRAGDRWSFRYAMPEKRFPQAAILVAATPDRSAVDWRIMLIDANPQIRIESEPLASVSLRVGERNFGPIQTDTQGLGRVPAVVPPGTNSAMVIATDRLGNRSETKLTLATPAFRRLVLLCPRGGEDLLIFAIDPAGRPLSDAEFVLSSSLGSVSEAQMVAPGVYAAAVAVSGSSKGITSLQVSGHLVGEAEHPTTCAAPIPAAEPNGVAVALDRTLVARDFRRVKVTVRLSYPEERTPAPVTPTIRADFGTLSPLEPAGDLRYSATWTLPYEFDERERANLIASIDGHEDKAALALDHRRLQPAWTVAGQLGYLSNFAAVGAPMLEAMGYYRLPQLRERILVGGELGFYYSSDTQATGDGMDESTTTVLAVPLMARAEYEHPIKFARIYGGLGAGLIFTEVAVKGSIDDPNTGERSSQRQRATLPGFNVVVGGRKKLGPGRVTMELSYWYASLSGDVADGNIGGLHLAAGYAYEL